MWLVAISYQIISCFPAFLIPFSLNLYRDIHARGQV
jgi:hypothetical protein